MKTAFTVVPYRNLPCTEKSILSSLHRSNPASFLPWMAVADSLRTKSAKNPLSSSPGKFARTHHAYDVIIARNELTKGGVQTHG